MARKRRAVECVSYLDEDPYEEADERSLMIDLNADSDKGTSKLNKNKQTGAGVKNGLNGVQSNADEVERLRTQLTEERREHRRALFDIRALIDRHIAKVGYKQNENNVFQKDDLFVPKVDKALEDEDDKTEVEKMKMKAVEVELNQEKSITEEIKRKVETGKKVNVSSNLAFRWRLRRRRIRGRG